MTRSFFSPIRRLMRSFRSDSGQMASGQMNQGGQKLRKSEAKIERLLSRIQEQERANSQILHSIQSQLDSLHCRVGKVHESLQEREVNSLQDAEFQVYSQWGEDGILQYLTRSVDLPNKVFVEFGVETYREANTRWLLTEHGWKGMVIDGSDANVDAIRSDSIYWKQDLRAVSSFITRDNINELISGAGIEGEIGLLSVDIDGVDYWVWEAITAVNPAIVVAEYNSLFGSERAVTVPYRPDFVRQEAHYSWSYYGASLRALELLGKKKGYSLVGSNSAGNNAFFVRDDLLREPLRKVTAAEAYVQRSFREARNEEGELLFPTFEEEAALIADLPLVEITE